MPVRIEYYREENAGEATRNWGRKEVRVRRDWSLVELRLDYDFIKKKPSSEKRAPIRRG